MNRLMVNHKIWNPDLITKAFIYNQKAKPGCFFQNYVLPLKEGTLSLDKPE